MTSQRSNKVAAAFQRYLMTGECGPTPTFSEADLERALQDYSLDSNQPFYRAMQDGLASRRRTQDTHTEIRRRGRNWLVAGLIGLITGVLATVLAEAILIRLGAR